jgi:hypothetical protein
MSQAKILLATKIFAHRRNEQYGQFTVQHQTLKGFGILVQNARTTLPFILGHYCFLWQEVGVCTYPPTPVKLGPAEIQVKQPGGMKGHRAGHIYIHLHCPFPASTIQMFSDADPHKVNLDRDPCK